MTLECLLLASALVRSPAYVEERQPRLSGAELVVREAGLDSTTLAVAGVTPTHLQQVIRTLSDSGDMRAGLVGTTQALDQAVARLSEMNRRMAATPGDPLLRAQMQALRAEVHAKQSLADTARAALRDRVVVMGAQESTSSIATAARGCRAIGLPPSFTTLPTTDANRRALARALMAERRALVTGQSIPGPANARLAAARTNPAVTAASARLNTHAAELGALLGQRRAR